MSAPQQILREHFGFQDFRPLQREIIEHALSGQDALVIMPTGGGKSVCFQVPALILPDLTLVISPLVSLMKDQVDSLNALGVQAGYYNSTLSEFDKAHLIEACFEGNVKLLYVSPESLVPALQGWLRKLRISLLVVDEAHCVSMWGHDFRPEYNYIKQVREYFPQIPLMALTATADKVTRQDIVVRLGMRNPQLFLASFDRPNLKLSVRSQVPKPKKEAEILEFIRQRKTQSGIVYCLSRKETEQWTKTLLDAGISARFYHAGMPSSEREEVQDAFLRDEIQVICATIAFGMGIDKSNVRWIIHNNLPKNLEGYYQEIGRAGRDGLPADTVLYYNYRDVVLLNDFIRDSEFKDLYQEKIKRMLQFAEAATCRRTIVLSYFGENVSSSCGNCDNCLEPLALTDATILAQKALSAVARCQESVGINLLINVLRGADTMEIRDKQLNLVKTYGAGKELSFVEWQHYINQFINQGILEIAYDQGMVLKLTALSQEILNGSRKLQTAEFKERKSTEPAKSSGTEEYTADENLLQLLKDWRKGIASEHKVPPYVIFHDSTLTELAALKPIKKADMLGVTGMGKVKFERFGEELIEIIASCTEAKVPKKSTFEQTFELYEQGLDVAQIASVRQMSENTIYGHLARLHEEGKPVNLNKYVTEFEVNQVKEARKRLNNTHQLKPIYEALNGEVDYRKIGLALSILSTHH